MGASSVMRNEERETRGKKKEGGRRRRGSRDLREYGGGNVTTH